MPTDVWIICETHLKEKEKIEIDGFQCFNQNRAKLHPKAPKGSGGVAFLVKNEVLLKYKLIEKDSIYEGIFWIELVNKLDDKDKISFVSCYLPPEGSSRGNSAQEFYDTLLTQIYNYWDNHPLFISGDFNGRIAAKQDVNPSLDTVPPRIPVPGESSNTFGNHLIEFLKDSVMCTVNGRGDPNEDDFTFIKLKI